MALLAAFGLAACGFGEEGVSVSDGDPNHEGAVLFATHCSGCHTLSAAGSTGTIGPNLDQLKPPKSLVLDAVLHGRARGAGTMPAGLYTGQDAQDVAAYVAAAACNPCPKELQTGS